MRRRYVKQSITGAPNRFEALVTLHAPADEITSRVPGHWGAIEPIDADTCEYRTGDDNLRWLAWRIAMLGVDFEVHEPPELIEHLRALASRLTRAVAAVSEAEASQHAVRPGPPQSGPGRRKSR